MPKRGEDCKLIENTRLNYRNSPQWRWATCFDWVLLSFSRSIFVNCPKRCKCRLMTITVIEIRKFSAVTVNQLSELSTRTLRMSCMVGDDNKIVVWPVMSSYFHSRPWTSWNKMVVRRDSRVAVRFADIIRNCTKQASWKNLMSVNYSIMTVTSLNYLKV